MKTKMAKKEKMRDLLCVALNEIIKFKRIKINDPNEEVVDSSIFTVVEGKKSKISWRAIDHGQVRITIWWGIKPSCLDNSSTMPLNRNMNDALDVCCSGWLERLEGIWLQGYGDDFIFDTYCAKSAEIDLFSIPEIMTNGYKKEGIKY